MTLTTRPRRALLTAFLLLPLAVHAQTPGEITATAPWSRAAGQGRTGAGFLTLRNAGSAPDRLISATSPVARTVELHTHMREGEVMRMRPVQAIDLPPGQEVRLAPGGMHLMLIGLTRPLRQGERVPVTLVLERGGRLDVALEVLAAGARGPGGAAPRH